VHFDRNGFGYTLDRTNGALLVAEKYDPKVNWATHVDMKTAAGSGRQVLDGEERSRRQHQGRLPGGARQQGPATCRVRPETKLFYVPTNHVCMDYEPFKVEYTAGNRTSAPPCRCSGPGSTAAWATTSPGTPARQDRAEPCREVLGVERRDEHRGRPVVLRHARGYLKCVDKKDINKELFKFKTPSGIIGNVFSYEHKGSSTSACSRALAAGPASAWRRASRRTPTAWVPWAAIAS